MVVVWRREGEERAEEGGRARAEGPAFVLPQLSASRGVPCISPVLCALVAFPVHESDCEKCVASSRSVLCLSGFFVLLVFYPCWITQGKSRAEVSNCVLSGFLYVRPCRSHLCLGSLLKAVSLRLRTPGLQTDVRAGTTATSAQM